MTKHATPSLVITLNLGKKYTRWTIKAGLAGEEKLYLIRFSTIHECYRRIYGHRSMAITAVTHIVQLGCLQLLEILEISWNLNGPPGNFCVMIDRIGIRS